METNQLLVPVTNALASFPWIADPQRNKNDQGKEIVTYNVDLIMEPNDPAFAKFMQLYAALAQEKWKENAQAAMQRIQMDRKTRCYGAGEEKVSTKTFQVHPGYPGKVFISARHTRQPIIVGPDGRPVDPANTMAVRTEAQKIYGGCYVNAVIKPWLQQNGSGIGIRCELVAIQFAKDGTPFGAAPVDVSGLFGQVAGTSAATPIPMAGSPMPSMPFPQASPTPVPAAPSPAGLPAFFGLPQ